ncbi:MogA/MoaB family molybdenum cofactor biosynthesis protein [Epidermidibacterium keratini]|uniref:MogA/MoaB family molybdenum cofactor biosynthesis protein n=1 Tax=Epidermidibacterium keratini TaxID=1891644 RepID=A0A7L4YR71_9ACTN|nr:MogA/MoaB family molybdenum cofactor biosynthesis protein [Epidermidibacterium keratini]QHC01414.1 MogA/MoaB family molybdenum cofactor biosynthesis protein [Epidermidibacterium keratini]
MSDLPADATALVVTASNRASAGVYDDSSGEFAEEALRELGFGVRRVVLPDDEAQLADALRAGVAEGRDLILTTGGTGLTPTDRTPEATRTVIERDAPGIADAVRRAGSDKVPTAVLSRGIAGVAGRSLIVNLPGSRGGVKDGLAVLRPLVGHIVSQLRGGDHPRG